MFTLRRDQEWSMTKLPMAALCLWCSFLLSESCHAALSDEIQVYTDDINAPREFGLELHANTTPRGRRTPEYPGEVVPDHGIRLTPEFSYGLTDSFEGGLYLPVSRDASGNTSLAGSKLRLKWLPIRGREEEGGWFLGTNGELSWLQQKFSASRNAFELRFMGGYRAPSWLLAVNPVFGWNLSSGYREKTPDLGLSMKASHKISDTVSLGAEYYSALGTTAKILPHSEQDNSVYAAIDVDTKKWELNFGIGHGLTHATDKLAVKVILGFPF
jgi:hypothetical protein